MLYYNHIEGGDQTPKGDKKMKTISANVSSGGVSFGAILTIVFIVLKLTGVITWSWLWVLSPLWISLAPFLVAFIFVLLVAIIIAVVNR